MREERRDLKLDVTMAGWLGASFHVSPSNVFEVGVFHHRIQRRGIFVLWLM